MGLQKHHYLAHRYLAHHFLFGPATGHARLAFGADAFQFGEPIRRVLDDIENCSPTVVTGFLAKWGPIPLTIPEPKCFSMPFKVLGGTILKCQS